MERAHRIGQTKPVRVFRLVCRGSVEERMVSRADKKLFLNAMVAEADPDTDIAEDEDNSETSQQMENEVMHALGVQGPTISKRELSSLIRFGANAIFNGNSESDSHDISEDDLNNLLERRGRDVATNDTNIISESASVAENALFQHQTASNKLKEVDLRQLGKFVYQRKKAKKGNEAALSFDFLEKRKRVERIKMVDGKGTGYGAAVPVLASNLEESDDEVHRNPVTLHKRGREWTHQQFCCLCGKRNEHDATLRCAHCPRIFHTTCLEHYDPIWKGSGMFICPHHKCAGCGRSTASSGGLLFRCVTCLTSFCEDCLPQDEIESVGRCKELESIGYVSKQSYYIKCPSCLVHDGSKQVEAPSTIPDSSLVDVDNAVPMEVNEETNNQQVEEVGFPNEESPATDAVSFATQLMRIYSEEIPETPKPKKSSRSHRSSKRSNKKRRSFEVTKKKVHKSKDEQSDKEMERVIEKVDKVRTKAKRSSQASAKDVAANQSISLAEVIGLLLSKGEEAQAKFVFGADNSVDNMSIRKKLSTRAQQWQSLAAKVISGKLIACY
jgi:hypothetical protein